MPELEFNVQEPCNDDHRCCSGSGVSRPTTQDRVITGYHQLHEGGESDWPSQPSGDDVVVALCGKPVITRPTLTSAPASDPT